ncbi:MAG: oligosaccharide flippase family protein [Planctomycetota bacterium]
MIRRAAVRGTLFGLLGQGAQLALYFAGYVILAGYLDKEEIGLAAMVLVVTGVFGVAADWGMGLVSIQRAGIDDRRVTGIAATAGLCSALCIGLPAPWIATLFGEPEGLVPLLRAGAVALLIAGLAATARARIQRSLSFGRLFSLDLAVELVRATARVWLAVQGLGAWSIVLGDLLALAMGTALAWILAPGMQSGDRRDVAADGTRIVGARGADACFVQADRFAIGSGLGTGAVGLYSFAYQHTLMAVQRLTAVAEQVALPIFSRLQEDDDALASAYLTLTRTFALLVLPAAALLWVLAPWLVDLLYPERWRQAVPVLRALCVTAAAVGINSHPGLVWIAKGRLRLRLVWSAVNLPLLVPFLVVGLQFGVEGVAHAIALRHLLATAVAQELTRRIAGVRHRGYLVALSPAAALAALIVLFSFL